MGPRGPKGTQGYPRVPKGTLGGMGPRGPLGLYRSHSEWNPVSIGWLLRNDSELKIVAGKPSERKGFKVLLKPLEDQGGLGSEIMPRRCMGSIGREITKQFVATTSEPAPTELRLEFLVARPHHEYGFAQRFKQHPTLFFDKGGGFKHHSP